MRIEEINHLSAATLNEFIRLWSEAFCLEPKVLFLSRDFFSDNALSDNFNVHISKRGEQRPEGPFHIIIIDQAINKEWRSVFFPRLFDHLEQLADQGTGLLYIDCPERWLVDKKNILLLRRSGFFIKFIIRC